MKQLPTPCSVLVLMAKIPAKVILEDHLFAAMEAQLCWQVLSAGATNVQSLNFLEFTPE